MGRLLPLQATFVLGKINLPLQGKVAQTDGLSLGLRRPLQRRSRADQVTGATGCATTRPLRRLLCAHLGYRILPPERAGDHLQRVFRGPRLFQFEGMPSPTASGEYCVCSTPAKLWLS